MMEAFIYHCFVLMTVLTIFCRQVDGNIISTFFTDYDKAIRPDFEKGVPVTIRSTLYVESFGNIEEANMEYKVYGYFRQYWNDPRLAGKLNRTLTIKGSEIDNLWVPDPFCYNARESNMMMPNEEIHSFVHIQANGDIELSKGVTLLASCVMNLHHFPLDTQTCSLKFGSYGHTTEDIIYEWHPKENKILVGNKEMAQFEYEGSKLSSEVEVFPTANFSTITATFLFHRRIGYFLIQVYFPDIFVVALSWIVFWMEKDDVGDRMALGITTILTIMFLLGSLNGNLPKVSYPKALDWYLLVSFSFVFFSLIECLVVFVVARRARGGEEKGIKYKERKTPFTSRICSSMKTCLFGTRTHRQAPDAYRPSGQTTGLDDDIEMAFGATKASKFIMDDGIVDQTTITSQRLTKRAEAIDKASRILFPLTFALYNIYYWTYYQL